MFTAVTVSSSANTKVQRMVAGRWDTYLKEINHPEPAKGGAALYLTSPAGNFFAAANMSDAGPDIHFRPASITKTFTAAAIMLLHQRGELNIDDLVTARAPRKGITYLPDSNDYNIPNKNSITIRSLLNHTAGVFDIENNDIPAQAPCPFAGMDYIGDIADQNPSHQFTFDELAGVVAACRIKSSDPWQHEFHYSDTGYSLLGKIIEQVSGMSYSDFILNNLVKPNGLNNTFSPHNAFDTAMPVPAPQAYILLDRQVIEVDKRNMSAGVANGNIISTPADLTKWIKLLISGKAGIEKSYVNMMTDCTIPEGAESCYGLGLFKYGYFGYGHTGGTDGFLSFMAYDPEHDVATTVFFTLYNGNDIVGEFLPAYWMVFDAKTILSYTTN